MEPIKAVTAIAATVTLYMTNYSGCLCAWGTQQELVDEELLEQLALQW